MTPHPAQLVAALHEAVTKALAMIREAHAAECAARKKFWTGGVPTSEDLHAVAVHVAARLKTTPEIVKATVAGTDRNPTLSPKDH
jgi:hypothetical protein